MSGSCAHRISDCVYPYVKQLIEKVVEIRLKIGSGIVLIYILWLPVWKRINGIVEYDYFS